MPVFSPGFAAAQANRIIQLATRRGLVAVPYGCRVSCPLRNLTHKPVWFTLYRDRDNSTIAARNTTPYRCPEVALRFAHQAKMIHHGQISAE